VKFLCVSNSVVHGHHVATWSVRFQSGQSTIMTGGLCIMLLYSDLSVCTICILFLLRSEFAGLFLLCNVDTAANNSALQW